ncbi:hypothetical protein [Actinocatenispora comari]|uniref:Uncharacterized protein n=1 Tax=Actinocatenispora comari TaxID=2807577 RepID=A0A8J4EJU9_9ACTN|nr:hypothetical protein [Actinocatenispora comari]GIL26228.1 hypothetical protein NUM_14820 [Actinocatenispora comari]
MSRRVYHDEDGQPYYELICDGCRCRLACTDDSCYDWDLLRAVAESDGWDLAAARPTGPHRCRACALARSDAEPPQPAYA